MPTKTEIASLPTLSEEELARTVELSLAGLGERSTKFAQRPDSTIEPGRLHASGAGRRAIEALDHERGAGIAGGLTFGATIGEGGMGIVRAATQRSLGRTVAVKSLKSSVQGDESTLRLLREAWVTGSLEHPNIMPIYDLGLDENGAPLIVLKHIEGAPWSELLADPPAARARFGVGDLLEHHLKVLVQLCNAVSFAHAHGIIHRDLKPDNVMIGRFGEVYLVDWGIAVSLRDDPTGRLPVASSSTEPAGTPVYMAPEMLGGTMSRVDERTDVYLLGAILYEILAGQPPHTAPSFRQIVSSILRSEPSVPKTAAPELVAIARRAMSRSAEQRFASADDLRKRLEWYLRHRGSLALSAEAASRVEELQALLERGADADTEEARVRVNRLFAEARFGFRQALRECGDNDDARTGLIAVTKLVVDFELERGTPEAAAAALAELEEAPSELTKRVADARDAAQRRRKELERLGAELDHKIGMKTRRGLITTIMISWMIIPELVGWLDARVGGLSYSQMYGYTVLSLLPAAGITLWARESMMKTAVNRRVLAVAILVNASQLTLEVGGSILRVPTVTIWPLHLYTWFIGAAAFTVIVDRRFWPAAIAYMTCFLVAAMAPWTSFHGMALANVAFVINTYAAWWPARRGNPAG